MKFRERKNLEKTAIFAFFVFTMRNTVKTG